MKNFARAVRLALAYRWSLIGTVISALMVGVLWGANIGAVGPFVEVAIKGKSLQQWAQEATTESASQLLTLNLEARALQPAVAAGDARAQADLDVIRARLKAEEAALQRAMFVKPLIDRYLPRDPFDTLVLIALALLVGTLLKEIFLMMNNVLVDNLALLASQDLRKLLYRRVQKLELAAFGAEGSGELMSRFTFDLELMSRGFNSLFGKAIREPLKMLACLVGASLICWRLLLLSLILAPLAAISVRKLASLLRRANRKAMEEMSRLYAMLEESFLGVKVVKAFTMERYERRRFHLQNKKYYRVAMRIVRYESLTHPLTELTGVATILLALLSGAYLVLKGETHLLGLKMTERPLSLSSLLLFYGLLSGVSDPARKLSEVFSRLQRAAAAADRVYSLVDREPEIKDPPRPQPLPRHHREVAFRNIHFGYVPGKQVLEDVDLTVKFGETVAIVGPNGCGKSTLLSMLPRFYDPGSGQVLIDGVDIRNVRMQELRQQIGLVTQETLLFDDTVYNNILYGRPRATREEVFQAARQAHAHRFITERLADGYETIVGQLGSQLSGGQRQRIALARAILRDPSILILDEATSQIDLEDEQLIHKVLEKFVQNRTTFIITHRMSTLVLADRVVVMKQGKIIDVGTHDELIRRCSLYARLHDLQFRESA